MTAKLTAFLAAASSRAERLSTILLPVDSPPWVVECIRRDLPAALSLLRAFAEVVEEAREVANMTHDDRQDVLFLGALESLSKKVQAADAAVAEMGEK